MGESSSGPEVRRAALALFRRWFDQQARWLVVQRGPGTPFQVVEAECLERESCREALDRELAWQLHLRRGKDYIISSVPRLHLDVPTVKQYCSGEEELTIEAVEFYLVELFGSSAVPILESNPNVQWWDVEQILKSSGGQEFSPRQRSLLSLSDVFSDCHP